MGWRVYSERMLAHELLMGEEDEISTVVCKQENTV